MLAEKGLYSEQSWHQSCFPGRGDTDWKQVFSILHEGNYAGTVDIEGFNDAQYTAEREIQGQTEALQYLKKARNASI